MTGGSRRLGWVVPGAWSQGDPPGVGRRLAVVCGFGGKEGQARSLVPRLPISPPCPPGPEALHTQCPFALPHFL